MSYWEYSFSSRFYLLIIFQVVPPLLDSVLFMIVIYPMVVVANIRLRHKILFFGQALHEKYDKEHVNCTRITVQSYISGCITGIRRQRLLIQDNLIFFFLQRLKSNVLNFLQILWNQKLSLILCAVAVHDNFLAKILFILWVKFP
jgi:hypothetical protein